MSSKKPHEGLPPDSPSDVRPLPARPNLEFERKQAKKLLAALHDGDAEALARVHAKHRASTGKSPDEFQLSDAQFTIAREYGFTSWPKLVEYFETLAKHEASGQRLMDESERFENFPRFIVRGFNAKLPWVAAAFTRFVPRFYGRSATDVFAATPTEADIRLVAARMQRYPSWDVLTQTIRPRRDRWREDSPMRRAGRAIRNRDAERLKALLAQHPELTEITNPAEPWATSVVYSAIHAEMRSSEDEFQGDSDWLASIGIPLQPALNWLLLGFMRTRTNVIQWLLDHGADPEWIPPNGISVLEHAIYRYWNGEAVDLIARRVKPREAMWVAAGIGDAAAVKGYFDHAGRLTDAARNDRPDFTAMGHLPAPSTFGDSDTDILWESFLLAGWNNRFAVMDVLLDHGLPVDYKPWEQSFLQWAIFEGSVPLVEYLVRRGAQIDDRTRSSVEEHFGYKPADPRRRRIMEICGGRAPDIVIREFEERRSQRLMQTAPDVETAFKFAKVDAMWQGQSAVSPENLFVGMLREDGMPVYPLVFSGVDLLKLRSALGERFDADTEAPVEMTANSECTAILMAARKEAEDRKHAYLTTVHMFYALMKQPPQSVVDLIRSSEGDVEKVLPATEKILAGMH